MIEIENKGNVRSFMKKDKKKRSIEYIEGHRIFFVIISLYFFCIFLCFSVCSVGSCL